MLTWRFTPIIGPVVQNHILTRMIAGAAFLQVSLTAFALPGFQCPFLHIIGLPCPGCGLSRAVVALLQGQWEASLTLHAFAPFCLAFLLLIAIASLLPGEYRQRLSEVIIRIEHRTGGSSIVLVALMLYWVARLALDPHGFIQLLKG